MTETTGTSAVPADIDASTAADPAATAEEAQAAADAAAREEIAEQKAVRLAKRDRLIASGVGAYPVSVPVTARIADVRERFADLEPDQKTGETVGVAGRVVHLRNTGKLCFPSLQAGDGSRIQAMDSLAGVGEESLAGWKEVVDLGDQ